MQQFPDQHSGRRKHRKKRGVRGVDVAFCLVIRLMRSARGEVCKTNQLLGYEARKRVQRRFVEEAEDGRCTALLNWVGVNCLCFWLGLKTWKISLTEK